MKYVVVTKKRAGARLADENAWAKIAEAHTPAEAVQVVLENRDLYDADGSHDAWAIELDSVPSVGIARRDTLVSVALDIDAS